MAEQKPSIGRVVHYVSHGSPLRPDGTQAFQSQCRAAIVTEVADPNFGEGETDAGLCVLNPTGLFFHSLADGGCAYDGQNGTGGTWHWPERV